MNKKLLTVLVVCICFISISILLPKGFISNFLNGYQKLNENQLNENIKAWVNNNKQKKGFYIYSLEENSQPHDLIIYFNENSSEFIYKYLDASVKENDDRLVIDIQDKPASSDHLVGDEIIIRLKTRASKENIQVYYNGKQEAFDYTKGP